MTKPVTMPVTINVTQKHIDWGVPRRTESSPISFAMEEAGFPVVVHTCDRRATWFWYDCDGGRDTEHTIDLPPSAVDFVRTFNNDPAKAEPFSFTLTSETEA